MNIEEIKSIIPHREPFLLIDEIIELEVGKRVVAKKYVKEEEYYFKGHFPKNPVMPGVLTIESLAQAGAVCILSSENFKGKTAYFAGIDKAKFKKKVFPGDVLTLEVKIIKCISSFGVGEAVAYDEDGKIVASATIKFAIQ